MNAARIMWTVCGGVAALNIAAHGRTSVTRPSAISKPVGWFIHAFAVTTKNALAVPASSTGTPASSRPVGDSRSHAYSQIPRKIASMKKAMPSSANGRPITGPSAPATARPSRS